MPSPFRSAARPILGPVLREAWQKAGGGAALATLHEGLRPLVTELGQSLPALAASDDAIALSEVFAEPAGEVLLSWCAASTWRRRDVSMALLLALAAAHPLRERVARIARDRVVEGPLLDALACAPLLGDWAPAARAPGERRGARAARDPHLGGGRERRSRSRSSARWLWGSPRDVRGDDPRARARRAARSRARRALPRGERRAGCRRRPIPSSSGSTLQVLQPLLLHPEPLVWVHAARALGRLTGPLEQLEGTLLDWVLGESRVLRQRAMTAFASLPAERLTFLARPARRHPRLARRRGLGARGGRGGDAVSLLRAQRPLGSPRGAHPRRGRRRDRGARARARARRRSGAGARVTASAHATSRRRSARCARWRGARAPSSLDESRRWIEVIAVTDAVDGAERDPLDLELGLENLMRLAAQYDDEEADARAARFAGSLAPTFHEARRIALGAGRHAPAGGGDQRARGVRARLRAPPLGAAPGDAPRGRCRSKSRTSRRRGRSIARAPAGDPRSRRRSGGRAPGGDLDADLPLEVLAIRLGGYALDACGEDADLGPGRGPTAHDTCLWLRKLEGLADGSRELPAPLKGALSALFWRLVDTTRGTALGEVDDVRWLGPFAAWWALVIDRPAMLLQLATALPMMAEGALARCCEQAEALRTAVSLGRSPTGSGARRRPRRSRRSTPTDTELAHALAGLARALEAFAARGRAQAQPRGDVPRAGARGRSTARRARRSGEGAAPGERGERERGLARAQRPPRTRRAWPRSSPAPSGRASCRCSTSGSRRSARSRRRCSKARCAPPSAGRRRRRRSRRRRSRSSSQGYELVKPLGEGGIGSVWLVRKPGADRLFVLKIPKAEALANANDTEREGHPRVVRRGGQGARRPLPPERREHHRPRRRRARCRSSCSST